MAPIVGFGSGCKLRLVVWLAVRLFVFGLLAEIPLAHLAAVPQFFEPKEDYYKARGSGIVVTWELDRTEVPEDGQIEATLVVKDVENPGDVVRPDLSRITEFQSRFQIENGPEQPIAPNAREVRFRYRLHPRIRDVEKVPSLWFAYYNPRIPAEDKRFPKTKAAAVAISVIAAAPKPPPPAVPLDAPEHLFVHETGSHVLGREPFHPNLVAWAAVVALGPIVALGWWVVWRRFYPDAARLAHLRRRRDARRVTDAIRRAGKSPDPAAVMSVALLHYLRSRYSLPPGVETPTEIRAALRSAGLDDLTATVAMEFFRACDAARFAPPSDHSLSLASQATALLTRLELAE